MATASTSNNENDENDNEDESSSHETSSNSTSPNDQSTNDDDDDDADDDNDDDTKPTSPRQNETHQQQHHHSILSTYVTPTTLHHLNTILPILLHILIIALYIIPITTHHPHYEAVLDEMHIEKNPDVNGGTTSISQIFMNDYWGRPMHAKNSHRSWRPLTILSFRWLNGDGTGLHPVLIHRVVNVVIHAALAEVVSLSSLLLFPSASDPLLLRCLTKLLFAYHPTHVEAVANGANRNHLLAVLCSVLMSDYRIPLGLLVFVLMCGLLSSETQIFQLPAVIVTMTVIHWKQQQRGTKKKTASSLIQSITTLLPRYFLVITFGLVYLIGRYAFDTLSIPDGLIRPAENPFYEFTGLVRVLNYSLILSIHIAKSFFIDPIGFSHEYGYNCVPKVESWDDQRLLLPVAIAMLVGVMILISLKRGLESTLNLAVALSWLFTLFPISGIIKVGTFIADRLVIPSTFVVAVFGSNFVFQFVFLSGRVKCLVLLALFNCLHTIVTRRTVDWMDSISLLESSLRSCPESAKTNLEMSKIYSGMMPDLLDLEKARSLLDKAESIDPSYCDVHQQIAGILFQQGKYNEFEGRLTKSVLCPFTTEGAVHTFRQYWSAVMKDPRQGKLAKIRYERHMGVIQEAIEREQQKKKGGGKEEEEEFLVGMDQDEL